MGKKRGGDWLREGIQEQVAILNNTLHFHDAMLMVQNEVNNAWGKSSESLLGYAQDIQLDERLDDKLGILNWKLDRVSEQLQKAAAEKRQRAFVKSIRDLSKQWSSVGMSTVEYLSASQKLVGAEKSIVSSVDEYTSCSKAGASFIGTSSAAANKAAVETQKLGRELFDNVLTTMSKQAQHLSFMDVPHNTVRFAASSVRLPGDKPARHWISREGFADARDALKDKVDTMPLALAKQVATFVQQATFLHSQISRDGGVRPSKAEDALFADTVTMLSGQLSEVADALRTGDATLQLLQGVIDQQAVANSPAPSRCKDLAFEQYNDAETSDLIQLGELESSRLVLSRPMSRLLSADAFRVSISKD